MALQTRGANETAPQPPNDLKPMVKITWTRGPNLPQGYQDSDGGFIGNTLISVGGFCSGLKEDNAKKPGIYPRGFLKKTWGLDVSSTSPRWQNLPEFPGAARQGLFAAVVNEHLYLMGGFSYEQPFSYDDGWKLSKTDSGWAWSPLPKLPWKLTSAGAAVVGSKIYVVGGADYDGVNGFHTDADRGKSTPRLGARMLVLDTQHLAAGWKELAQCPGTPRFVHAVQAVGERIYVIGGATGLPTYTVVDNWMFDTSTETWTRVRDLPIASGNFPKSSNLLFQNRYIVLPGGYQYGQVINPDGSLRPPYGKPSNLNKGTGLFNDVFVYDVESNRFGTADGMPIDNNLPMTVVRGERIYLLGGETGGGIVEGEFYGHHPDLLLIGHMQAIEQ
jgi:N-acetylneuraminic acid mutarotase